MTDLNAMWEALARYQPYADADGHGESWRVMCEQRTAYAAWAAEAAAYAAASRASRAAAWAAADAAAADAAAAAKAEWAAWAAEAAADAAYWSDLAIKHIEQAIKERA